MKKINSRICAEVKENSELFTSIRRSDIAHHFKGCMARKGLKISDLAERLNVSSANISRMLNGRQNLTLDKMHELADALQERLVLALESNWQTADFLTINLDIEPKEKYRWKISKSYLDVNVQDYACITAKAAKAANDSKEIDSRWQDSLEEKLEQRV